MSKETVKDVKGYDGLYKIHSSGVIESYDRFVSCGIGNGRIQKGRIISQQYDGNYCIVKLTKNGIQKTFRVHRLVSANFIENPDNKPCVNHIDGIKKNNCYSNLEWCTHSENQIHSRRVLGNKSGKEKRVIAKCKITRDILFFKSAVECARFF
jgi:hypothetical protein